MASRAERREAIKRNNERVITSGLSPSEAQARVAADIAAHGGEDAKEVVSQAGEAADTQSAEQGSQQESRSQARAGGILPSNALGNAARFAQRSQDRLAAQRTPGGIVALVVILLVLVFVLIPVDKSKAYSRAQLIVLSLLGRTRLIGHRVISAVVPVQATPLPAESAGAGETDEALPHIAPIESLYNPAMYDPDPIPEESAYWSGIDNIGSEE